VKSVTLCMLSRAGFAAILWGLFSLVAVAEPTGAVRQQSAPVAQNTHDEQAEADRTSQPGSELNPKFRLKDDPQSRSGTDGGQSVLNMVLGLFAVLAVIAGLAWLSKRFNLNLPGATSDMKLLGAMSIGSKEKLLLVEVEGSKLLLGVTPQQVTLIKNFEGGDQKPKQSEFSDKMQLLLKAGTTHDS